MPVFDDMHMELEGCLSSSHSDTRGHSARLASKKGIYNKWNAWHCGASLSDLASHGKCLIAKWKCRKNTSISIRVVAFWMCNYTQESQGGPTQKVYSTTPLTLHKVWLHVQVRLCVHIYMYRELQHVQQNVCVKLLAFALCPIASLSSCLVS